MNHSGRLWALVNFEMWLRPFIDGEDASKPQFALTEVTTVKSRHSVLNYTH